MATNHLQKFLNKSKAFKFWNNDSPKKSSEDLANSGNDSKKLSKLMVKVAEFMRASSSKKLWKNLVNSTNQAVLRKCPSDIKKLEELLKHDIKKLEELMKSCEAIAASVEKHNASCRGCQNKLIIKEEQQQESENFYDCSESF